MTDALMVFCSVGSAEEANRITLVLVEENLAGCVQQIDGVRSVYRWQGKVETSNETLLVIKTTGDRYAALEARLQDLHSYEVPEILALGVVGAAEAYLAWLRGG